MANHIAAHDQQPITRPAADGFRGELRPLPQLPGVSVREAVLEDIDFIDRLQALHKKAVGWMPTGQLEGHLAKGHVLIAEATNDVRSAMGDVRCGEGNKPGDEARALTTHIDPGTSNIPLGYAIGVDKYFKREDTGVIYQMNVAPGMQRGLIGATLLQAMFDRWPYGVRLCCCWCAQDLEANRFWEAMGFVALAFRSGSRKRSFTAVDGRKISGGRVHIFWQKPVRLADADAARRNVRVIEQGEAHRLDAA